MPEANSFAKVITCNSNCTALARTATCRILGYENRLTVGCHCVMAEHGGAGVPDSPFTLSVCNSTTQNLFKSTDSMTKNALIHKKYLNA